MSRRSTKRYPGLSKSVSLHGFRGGIRYMKVLHAGRQAECLRNIDERHLADIQDQGMDIQYDEPPPLNTRDSNHDSENNSDEFSGLSNHISGRDRIELQTDHWDAQMCHLVEAYLEFRSRNPSDSFLRDESAEVAEAAAVDKIQYLGEITSM
ncbi:hypothetical protein SCLCIDRAFT_26439 [Scleroderma citrinum Foug A]|uniref:Uncharacterized protein n=1 Tax=Scleroderma citrinum Foug A TaxID=1036808 RepID=A0A0C3DXW8_9AGAM|nr:hypothetical protein SCLCIDRAFT_26439 [Scleroderma citrinum Foug A]